MRAMAYSGGSRFSPPTLPWALGVEFRSCVCIASALPAEHLTASWIY